MKKQSLITLLLVVLMLCSLAGCGTAPQESGIPTGESTTTTTTQPEKSDELLSLTAVESVPEQALVYRDTTAVSYNYTLKVTANRDGLTLQVMTVNADSLKLEESLYTSSALAQGDSLYICTYVNDTIPNRGILCTDQQGASYAYTITYSGMNGSVSLTPGELSESNAPLPEFLTQEELVEMQDFLNQKENNGFVGTRYDTPEEVSLEWVLYDGAGVGEWMSDWDEAEKQALLSATGWEEFYVPVMKYPVAAVEQLVLDKLGLTLDEMSTTMEQEGFVYLPEYDAYYHMHGDTNYMAVVVVNGCRSADGTYYVHYHDAVDSDTLYELTLRKTENGYQFVSNLKAGEKG